ncbi:hypothetical protein [Arcanobacterium hippocoleae]|uniref:hypothetical protein n=1 Tax=Arcanobacterium hippocoleae TaxID=149017 RepID=UPI003342A161
MKRFAVLLVAIITLASACSAHVKEEKETVASKDKSVSVEKKQLHFLTRAKLRVYLLWKEYLIRR